MGLFGEWSTTLHKQDQTLAQKVCLRLVIQFLYRLLTLVAEYIIILPSTAFYCNVIFLHINWHGLKGGVQQTGSEKFQTSQTSCAPNPVLSYTRVFLFCVVQKYLEQGTVVLTGRHLRFWWLGFFVSFPLFFFSFLFFTLFERYQAREGRSTCMWLSYPWFSLISLSFRSLISYQKSTVSTTQHSRQKWKY